MAIANHSYWSEMVLTSLVNVHKLDRTFGFNDIITVMRKEDNFAMLLELLGDLIRHHYKQPSVITELIDLVSKK